MKRRLDKLKDYRERIARGEDVSLFIRTGLKKWDEAGGIERGILTVIGAATGDGKSIVALHLATAAAKDGLKVLLLSFEDPEGKTVDRSMSKETGLNNRAIGKLEIDDIEYSQMLVAYEAADWADNITFEPGLKDPAEVMRFLTEQYYDLVIIDYAQAMTEESGKTMEGTIRTHSLQWNKVAQDNHSAIVVLSQLNREVENRGRKQFDESRRRDPTAVDVGGYCPNGLSDVAWAKALADQCKCLLYWWRPNRMAKKLTGSTKIKDNVGKLIAGKANFSSEDDLVFHFDGATATISDWKD